MKYWTEIGEGFRLVSEGFNTRKKYCGNIMVLDLEVSSLFTNKDGVTMGFDRLKPPGFYDGMDKSGIVYIWMLSIDDTVYYGRTLDELRVFITLINGLLGGYIGVIYVHNLGYDLQFLRNIFVFDDMFTRKQRNPMKCTIAGSSIELRCSYILTKLKLEDIPKQYNIKINKKVGQLNYELVRHSKTPMSEEELEYCESDCLIIYEYIKLMLQEYRSFGNMPMTITSRVRKRFKDHLMSISAGKALTYWYDIVRKPVPRDVEELKKLRKAFTGGFVQIHCKCEGKVIDNVNSIDMASAYLYVMLTEKVPFSSFLRYPDTTLDNLDIDNYAYLMELRYTGIIAKSEFTPLLIRNILKGEDINKDKLEYFMEGAGKLKSASTLVVTVTEQDYLNIRDCYNYESVEVVSIYKSPKNYIPAPLATFIGKLYENKALLKQELKSIELTQGVDSDEYKTTELTYRRTKEELSSIYGMCVTNYITDNVIYDEVEGWSVESISDETKQSLLKQQRVNRQALLPYSWGVWVASYNRRNLIKTIRAMEKQYGISVLYTDTDSIKYTGDATSIIEDYNNECDRKVEAACSRYPDNPFFKYKFNFENLRGLGRFEVDGHYSEFKTLGVKKYAYRRLDDNSLHLTVSGLNKYTSVKALKNNINNFNRDLVFTYEESGNNVIVYNDNQKPLRIIDYQGTIEDVYQPYGSCVYPAEYYLDTDKQRRKYIMDTDATSGCKTLGF